MYKGGTTKRGKGKGKGKGGKGMCGKRAGEGQRAQGNKARATNPKTKANNK